MARWMMGLVLGMALLGLAACQSTQGPKLKVEDPWARSSPMNVEMGAIYLKIRNEGNEADALVGVQTEACKKAEIHETYQKEDGSMGMRPVEGGRVPLPPGETVSLEPGGLHIMCMGKQVPFEEGTRFSLTLTFANHEPITVEVEVRK